MIKEVLIVDDNSEFVVSLYKYIQNEIKDIKKIGIASNTDEAWDYIKIAKPDIIILDLKMSRLNGTEFLNRLNYEKIKVILVSEEIQLINEVFSNDYKNIKKIYIKPFDFKKLKEDFRKFEVAINSNEDKRIIKIINDELDVFSFNKKSIGYKYLIQCVVEVFKSQDKLNNVEKNLFPCVAQKLKVKNPKNIKWNLRKLIESMVRYTNTETILKYFPYTKNPTTKMFISRINENLISKYK